MSLHLLKDLIRRHWRVLMLAVLVSTGVGLMVGTVRPPLYESTARALVGPIAGDFEAVRAAGSNVETYAQLVSTHPVVIATIDRVGPPSAPDAFLQRVSVQTDQVSRIISITVTDTDRQRAADTANVLFEQLADLLPSGAVGASDLIVIDSARPSQDSTSLNPIILAALAGVAGFGAAVLCLIALEYLDGRVRSRYDLELTVEVPFLGAVRVHQPLRAANDDQGSVRVHGSAIELVSRLFAIGPDRPHSLLIPSLEAGDEAPELAATIASAAAISGMRVALIDGDDVSRRLTTHYGSLIGTHGTQAVGTERVGSLILVEPAMVVDGDGVGNVAQQLRTLREGRDLIVIQVGPLSRSRVANVWAKGVDVAVVAARSGSTRRDLLRSVADRLDALGVFVAGTALIEIQASGRRHTTGSSMRRAPPAPDGRSQAIRPGAELSIRESPASQQRDP